MKVLLRQGRRKKEDGRMGEYVNGEKANRVKECVVNRW